MKQRSTGSREPLPSRPPCKSVTLSVRQKENFIKLAKAPQNTALLYRFGLFLEEDFELPAVGQAHLRTGPRSRSPRIYWSSKN